MKCYFDICNVADRKLIMNCAQWKFKKKVDSQENNELTQFENWSGTKLNNPIRNSNYLTRKPKLNK